MYHLAPKYNLPTPFGFHINQPLDLLTFVKE